MYACVACYAERNGLRMYPRVTHPAQAMQSPHPGNKVNNRFPRSSISGTDRNRQTFSLDELFERAALDHPEPGSDESFEPNAHIFVVYR